MRRFIMLACLAVAATGLWAQKPVGSFSFIPRAGLSIASISGDEIYTGVSQDSKVEAKYNARFAGGIDVEYQALENLGVSLGVLYAQQGCRYSDFEMPDGYNQSGRVVSSIANSHLRQKNDYLQFPLMLNGYVAEGLAIKAGIQVGCLLNAKFSYDETFASIGDDMTVEVTKREHHEGDNKNLMKKVDFSIPIGVSYEYSNVMLDLRYNLGLTKVFDYTGGKNKLITFTVGYRI